MFEGKDGVKFMRNADAVNKLGSYIIIKHYGWVIKDLKDRLSGLANRGGLISIEDGQLKPRLSGNDASKLLEEIDSRLRRLLGDAAEEIIKSHDKALYIMNAEGVARLIQIMERRGIRIEDIKSSDIIKGVSMKDFIEIINKLKRECTVCLDSKELENEARNYNEIEEL
ncbi:hypothetical protein [Vulcanisaeta distributa]|uniref:hypothetical protein n=1 Tax=Vulcanisaeta distributa TaxID=164451 RepID=UPI001FB3E81D|nr:hypothetical protein [Vulcanisaeta distributa]